MARVSSKDRFFFLYGTEVLHVGIIIQWTETKRRIKYMPFVSKHSNAFFNVNSHTRVCVCVCVCVCIYIYIYIERERERERERTKICLSHKFYDMCYISVLADY